MQVVWNGKVCTMVTKAYEYWINLIEPYAPKYVMYRNISRELKLLGNDRYKYVRHLFAQEFEQRPPIFMSKKNMILAFKDKYIEDGKKKLKTPLCDSDID